MASVGSWIRLIIGVLLSIEVLWQWANGNFLTWYASGLAFAFIILTGLYFLFRF